jgi:hypothetical protein
VLADRGQTGTAEISKQRGQALTANWTGWGQLAVKACPDRDSHFLDGQQPGGHGLGNFENFCNFSILVTQAGCR